MCVCLYYCRTYYKAVRVGGDSRGHVLRETTSRGLGGLVCPCPSRTNADVCVHYCSTFDKAVRVGGEWGPCATIDDEPRPVWTRLPITHW
jgi:hypothetical protein